MPKCLIKEWSIRLNTSYIIISKTLNSDFSQCFYFLMWIFADYGYDSESIIADLFSYQILTYVYMNTTYYGMFYQK